MALLTIVLKTFPPWFLGIVGGAGALTAMVPAAVQVLAAAMLFVKNFCRPLFATSMNDIQVGRLAKASVLVFTALALVFAIYSSTSLVALLLLGYTGVAQIFPGVVLGLYSKRVTANGVFAGIVVGIAVVAFLSLSHRDPWMGLNSGFVGLCLNFAVTGIVSLLTAPQPSGLDEMLRVAESPRP
jgi:SSS family solute:Na+ symporter